MSKKSKIAIITILVIILISLGLQVYAYSAGYSNVFFLIKEKIIGESLNKDEIFSDEEIVLSYKTMDLTDGVSLQLTKIENFKKDNFAKLYMVVDNTSDKSYSFDFIVGDVENPQQKITKTINSKSTLEDVIQIDNVISQDDELDFNVLEAGQTEPLLTLSIDIANRQINIIKSQSGNQISQIELKRYIEAYTYLIQDNQINIPQSQVLTSIQIAKIVNPKNQYDRKTINEIAKTIFGNEIKMKSNQDILDVPTKEEFDPDNAQYLYYDKSSDKYVLSDNSYLDNYTKCVEITDISEEDNKYVVTFKAILGISEDELTNNSPSIEDKDVYQITMKLTKNDTNDIKYIYNQFIYPQDIEIELIDEKQTIQNNQSNNQETNQDNNQTTSTLADSRDSQFFGKWTLYNAYDIYGGMPDFQELFGSAYSQYGSYIILNSDYTFIDAIRPVTSSEFSTEGTFIISRDGLPEDECLIILNYSDGTQKPLEVKKDYYNETYLSLADNPYNQPEYFTYDFKK